MEIAARKPLYLAAVLSFVLSVVTAIPSFAEPEATPAGKFVQKLGDTALSSLTGKNIPHAVREQRVRELLEKNFDIQAIGKFAMGTYWKDISDLQRKQYMKLFEDRIVKVYTRRFEDYSGQIMKVEGTTTVDGNNYIVSSKVLQKNGPAVALEWRVRHKDGAYKIMDVVVEGISMSVTQRSDFTAVIQRGGGSIDTFLTSLRQQNVAANEDTDNQKT